MKNIKKLVLAGLTITLLGGCKEPVADEVKFEGLEIAEYPKTTFYCGENFSNNGITLTVKFSDGTSYTTEDVTTSKPSSMMTPGKQTIKAYYSNSEKDINAYVTYEINVIDWTKEEKAIFNETSISSLSGVYYPKMDGMKLVLDGDENGVTDYWIELENADATTLSTYLDLLDEYLVEKTMIQDGEQYKMTYKFYEQVDIPSDFEELYGDDFKDMICYKYCASYQFYDVSGIYELNGSEVEDTLVVGLTGDDKLVVRYIANSIMLESLLGFEVDNRFVLKNLLIGDAYTGLKKVLFGYEKEDDGSHVEGILDLSAPLAVNYLLMPDVTPEVCAIADYCAAYPWKHGEDLLCFEVMLPGTQEEYDAYIADIEAKDSFVKTTREEKVGRKTIHYTTYTIEDKAYVGDIVIEVSEYLPDDLSYTLSSDGIKKTAGSYYIYYRIQAPEVLSPTVDEICRIYDIFYGEGKYKKESIQAYHKGTADGLIKLTQFKETATHTAKDENEVENVEEAAQKFVTKALSGYTAKEALHEVTIQNTKVIAGTYENENFVITLAAYFAGNGKFAIEFTVEIKA